MGNKVCTKKFFIKKKLKNYLIIMSEIQLKQKNNTFSKKKKKKKRKKEKKENYLSSLKFEVQY